MTDVVLRDATLRDGLQLTGGLMSVERKADVVRTLFAAGVPAIEIGSLARPDLVPPLANSLELVAALTPQELERCWLWVATPGHIAKAAAAGIRNVQYCLSVSDSHNRANIGRDTATSMDLLPEALDLAEEAGMTVQLCLATSFTCPFEGYVDPHRVWALVEDSRGLRCSDIVVCDTLGQASPDEVRLVVDGVAERAAGRGIAFHGHDTWGMGVANALAAVESGAFMVDGCVGGLGGCPFAPGASGNTALEDLAFALRPSWVSPETLGALVQLGIDVTTELGEPNRSRATQGAVSGASAFPWAVAR